MVTEKTEEGRRRLMLPTEAMNLSAGQTLPRTTPLMSGTRHSTSLMRFSRIHSAKSWVIG
jgi:hypothetical protein